MKIIWGKWEITKKFSFCTFKKLTMPFPLFKESISFLIFIFPSKNYDHIFPELTKDSLLNNTIVNFRNAWMRIKYFWS